MIIVCRCDGLLEQGPRPGEEVIHCSQCAHAFPAKKGYQLAKIVRLAMREQNNDGTPANEHVRHQATRKAALLLAELKLQLVDDQEWKLRHAPPPAPVYAGVYYTYATTTGGNTGFGFGNVVINVTGW